ncbi:hypothetical protein OEG84_25085 [Hoeflea sp. G2-23]|uniref:Uncharacterized protein n=1 Tax=Hoeflea algicola TaxID=2983763 RepID=A0ABT3ZGK9_9HYPH|nr:hypothetical protein [Hoeflea algicola]MCY0150883.1 hypothetical protein [Hoeflea algicola]
MQKPKLLSDNDAHDRLIDAVDGLPDPEHCETAHGRTAIATAKAALLAIQMGLLAASEKLKP